MRRWHMVRIPESDARVYIEVGSGATVEVAMKDGRRFEVAEIGGTPRCIRHRDDCERIHPGQSCDGGWYAGALKDVD